MFLTRYRRSGTVTFANINILSHTSLSSYLFDRFNTLAKLHALFAANGQYNILLFNRKRNAEPPAKRNENIIKRFPQSAHLYRILFYRRFRSGKLKFRNGTRQKKNFIIAFNLHILITSICTI